MVAKIAGARKTSGHVLVAGCGSQEEVLLGSLVSCFLFVVTLSEGANMFLFFGLMSWRWLLSGEPVGVVHTKASYCSSSC